MVTKRCCQQPVCPHSGNWIQHEHTFISILQAAREALGWMHHQLMITNRCPRINRGSKGGAGVEAGWRGDLDDAPVYPAIKHR